MRNPLRPRPTTRRRRRLRVWTQSLLALVLAGLVLTEVAISQDDPDDPGAPGQELALPQEGLPGDPRQDELTRLGRRLFVDGCSSCHGFDARGIPGRGPSLYDAGEASAHFYLTTGRMPLDDPEDQPLRGKPAYPERDIRALVEYVGTLGDGPAIPEVHPERGSLAEGRELFVEHCAGCHQIVARGGIVPKALIPDLQGVTPTQVAEAMTVAPYLMSKFTFFDEEQVDSIARYVQYTEDPVDRGGWGIGHIGPVPEGMVTWLLAMLALVLFIRVLGDRTTQ